MIWIIAGLAVAFTTGYFLGKFLNKKHYMALGFMQGYEKCQSISIRMSSVEEGDKDEKA
jgi:hypothetical protein